MRTPTMLPAVFLGLLLIASSCRRETKDEKFRREWAEFTRKECPKEVAPYTRMDSVCYDMEAHALCEYYSVSGIFDVDSCYSDAFVTQLRSDILKSLRSSIQMKTYKDEGIAFRYVYRSMSTGKTLLDMTLVREEYE